MIAELDFVQYRPRPENSVCGDFFPSLFKGKYDPSEVPTISLLIVIPDEGLWKSVQHEFGPIDDSNTPFFINNSLQCISKITLGIRNLVI